MTDADASESRKRLELIHGSLVLFTLAVGFLSVLALAATLAQARLSNVKIDGVTVSLWKLNSTREKWVLLRTKMTTHTLSLSEMERARLELVYDQRSTEGSRQKLDRALANNIRALSSITGNPELAASLDRKEETEQQIRIINKNASSLPDDADVSSLLKRIRSDAEKHRIHSLELERLKSKTDDLGRKIKKTKESLKLHEAEIKVLIARVGGPVAEEDRLTQARIEHALYELNPTGGKLGEWMNTLITLQPDILALSLVLLMGVLGSALQILNSVFRSHRLESFGNYFLRISVGAITALVIFIVSKAGVPIITDTSRWGGDAPINPYFVSFLAIASGLLSEQAIITVQNQGERLFGSGTSEPDRWARTDLTSLKGIDNDTAKTLASYLGIGEDDTLSILKGQVKADATQQRTIATFLRSTVRELFSDIAPTNFAETPTQETNGTRERET